ncbi:MAG: tetratricopeptide repeat protein [Spirochaetes bacterium]|nr:tetratricopeptide repeat protein [Spirochaetota bacterium]
MKKYQLIFKIIFSLLPLVSQACSLSYDEIRIRDTQAVDKNGNLIDIASYNKINENQKLYFITGKRYLAFSRKSGLENELNRKAVLLIRDGKLTEASVYLSRVLSSGDKFPEIYNNLGVIHEINSNFDDALKLYFKACAADPENKNFIYNFRMAGK